MTIDVLGTTLEVVVLYKPQNKNCYLRIKDNQLIITHWKMINENEIQKIIDRNMEFITRALNKKKEQSPFHTIHLFGKAYDFKIVESFYDEVKLIDGMIYIYSRKMNYEYLKALVYNFYLLKLKDYITPRFNEIYKEFSDVLKYRPTLKFKYLKTAFGNCRPREYLITFSAICAKYEPILIDSVIYHELSHFKYQNHQEEFYNYYESKLPNAKILQKALRKIKYNDYF